MKTLEELKELNPNIEFNNTYCEIINELSKDGSHYIFVSGNAGSGKAQPLDTIIPTPNGNMRFGDLKVGDYVFDRKGNPTKIIGIYPRGELDLYKVTFIDGRVTYCNDDHLWTYITSKGNFKTVTLREMINHGFKKIDNRGHSNNVYRIPTNGAVEFNNIEELPIDPYVIGSFIGNGCNLQRQLTLSSNDEFNVSECAKLLGLDYIKESDKNYNWNFKYKYESQRPSDVRKDNIYALTKSTFKDFQNELCVKSHEKRIPDIYKYSSKENRYKLLQGLFDTDRSVSNNKKLNVSYSSTSKQLIDDIKEILYSLGYGCTIHFYSNDFKRTYYELSVNIDNSEKFKLFRLPRKLNIVKKYCENSKRRIYSQTLIDNIEFMNCKVPMMCIKVDNEEELYLTNDYIVTHNTTLLKTLLQMYEDKNVVACATTGVASSLLTSHGVYATTIFRALRIPVKSVYDVTSMYLGTEQRRLLSNIDLLIIDEISMLTVDLFEYIIAMFESVGHIPSIVMFGDILQLTPVVTKDVKKYYIENYQSNIYFFSSPIFDMYGFKSYILEKVYRQNDASFKDILNRLRENKLTDEDIKVINGRVATSEQIREWKNENKTNVTLASTNAIVQKMNEEILDYADGELYSLDSKISGDFMKSSEFQSGRYPTEIKVKIGLPVMITANQKGVEIPQYVNGDIGILTEVNEDEGFVRVELKNGNVVELEMNKTESKQIYFTMGDDGRIHAEETVTGSYENYPIVLYASSTFHKSQGCTLDKGIIYLNTSWYPENSLYVALSRFRSLDSFLLTHPLTKEMVSINKEASRFIEHMKKTVTSYEYEDDVVTKTVYRDDVITESIVRTPKKNVLVNPITKIESEIENLSKTLNISVEDLKKKLIESWTNDSYKKVEEDKELVPF